MGRQECPMPKRRRSDCDLGDLEWLSRSELRHLWREEFGGEPPSAFGGDLLALAIAHARQERQYGGIPKSVARELAPEPTELDVILMTYISDAKDADQLVLRAV